MAEEQLSEEELKNMSPEEMAELQKKNCVFCKIIKGEIPSHKVYEDDVMIALLDIYPAAKGHVLVLPKEHVPIMPLLKPKAFKHIFRKVKYLVQGVKKGLPAVSSSIFIANGAAAGQQSPHFLFHIIPRDSGDGLDNFNIPEKGVDQSELAEALRTNLARIMQSHLQKEGKLLVKQPNKKELAMILEQNPDLKEILINNPEKLKEAMNSNAQLKALFQGLDIDKLSEKLKENHASEEKTLEETKEKPEKEKEEPEKEPEKAKEKPEAGEKKEEKHSLLDKVTHMFTK